MSSIGESSGHRRVNAQRARENESPRTFLRARGGIGDPPTGILEDDIQPRRKKRHRALNSILLAAGPSSHASELNKPLPHPPSKRRDALSQPVTASSSLPNVRPAKSSARARKQPHHSSPALSPETDDDEYETQSTLDGPTAATSESSKLLAQITDLKKQLLAKDKQAEEQSKHLSKLKREVQNTHKAMKEQRAELDKSRLQLQRLTKVVSDVEQALQCQICIDILSRPYALSPCGHVLCQGCLQDWFRQAPVNLEDMNMDEEVPSLMHRTKTCPVCRARVTSRPLQLFALKAVLATLNNASAGSTRASPPPELDDPWEGIFARPRAQLDDNDDGEGNSSGENDESDDSSGMDEDGGLLDAYDNTSDDEYGGEWTNPSWEPPEDRLHRRLHSEPFFDSLLRRGATLEMIQRFDMDYTHADGISARDGDCTLYLGFNIGLAHDDADGSRFMEWCFEDMDAYPERWALEDDGRVAVRCVRADGPATFRDADSEDWIDSNSEDEDVDDEEME